jgi:hypothetical protein
VVMKSIIFWDMTPCSPLSFNRRFGGTYCLHLQGRRWHSACQLLARWFAEPISSTLKKEAICSSETSVETQRTTRRHISEGDTLHNHRCENLKSYIFILCFDTKFHMASSNWSSVITTNRRLNMEFLPPPSCSFTFYKIK